MLSIQKPLMLSVSEPIFPTLKDSQSLFDKFSSKNVYEQCIIINEYEGRFQSFLSRISAFEHHINAQRDGIYEHSDNSDPQVNVLVRINQFVLQFNRNIAETFKNRSIFYQQLKHYTQFSHTIFILNVTLSQYELESVKIEIYRKKDQNKNIGQDVSMYDQFARSLLGRYCEHFQLKNIVKGHENQNIELIQKFLKKDTPNQKKFIDFYDTSTWDPSQYKESMLVDATIRLQQLDGSIAVGFKQSLAACGIKSITGCYVDETNLLTANEYLRISQIFETRLKDYTSLKKVESSLDSDVYEHLNYSLSRLNLQLVKFRRCEFAKEVSIACKIDQESESSPLPPEKPLSQPESSGCLLM